jgi:hypothetical protein
MLQLYHSNSGTLYLTRSRPVVSASSADQALPRFFGKKSSRILTPEHLGIDFMRWFPKFRLAKRTGVYPSLKIQTRQLFRTAGGAMSAAIAWRRSL